MCDVCHKSFIQATQLRSHMFHHTGENGFRCDQCDLAFNRKSRLNAHIKSVHSSVKEEQPTFECATCLKEFPTEKKYEKHVESHINSKSGYLIQHHIFIGRHFFTLYIIYSSRTDEFICDICSKSFSSKQALQFHMRTHQKEEPCVCKTCNKMFIRKDCLYRHMKQQHRYEEKHFYNCVNPKKCFFLFVYQQSGTH